MNAEAQIAKEIADMTRKEKYQAFLANGRQLRAAARTKNPAKAPKVTKAPKVAETPKATSQWSIKITDIAPPDAEWSCGDEE